MAYNKYKVEVSRELLLDYYNSLINDTYKILPLYEGIDFSTKKIIYSPEAAYEQFQKYLASFLNEICGAYFMFDNVYLLKLTNNLEGMKQIKVGEHKKLKALVFKCISIINKLKEEMVGDT